MLTSNNELQRALRPKITTAAMIRRHVETAGDIYRTSATLGLTWWAAYIDAWCRVMFPEDYRDQ